MSGCGPTAGDPLSNVTSLSAAIRNCPHVARGLPAGGHLGCPPVVTNRGSCWPPVGRTLALSAMICGSAGEAPCLVSDRSSSVPQGRSVPTPMSTRTRSRVNERDGPQGVSPGYLLGPTGWKGGNSVPRPSGGLASGIELICVAKGDCIAEADDELPVCEPGHQDAVRPLPPGALDHPVDRGSDASVHGGPVADLDFDGFHILHVHHGLTSPGRTGRAV
jgi:hypothetical protein